MNLRKILRRTVWTFIVLVTVVALFYTEEDWRGALALRTAEKEYRAVGSLNYADFVPPAIPDDENLATLPIFAEARDPQTGGGLRPLALEHAMRMQNNLEELPRLGNWQLGQLPNAKAAQTGIAALFEQTFRRKPDSNSALAQFDAMYPFVDELSRAAEARPRCRFDFDYANPMALLRSFALMTDQIPLSRLITLHAVLALHENRPEVALKDLRTIFLLRSGVARDPSVIAQLVSIGMGAISETIVTDGLALHAWNDSQLSQLTQELATIDYLAGFRFALQGELAAQLHDLPVVRGNFARMPFGFKLRMDAENHYPINFGMLWPAGWLNAGAAKLIRFDRANLYAVDLASRRVHPDWGSFLSVQRDHTFIQGTYILPWNFIFAERSMALENMLRNSARAQAWADHSVIACALERYRLAVGQYPVSLNALIPTYIQAVPQDFMSGQPYHYRLQPDGSYLLYSVGWDEKDDGGAVVFDKDDPQHHRIDYSQGDWVWFGAK